MGVVAPPVFNNLFSSTSARDLRRQVFGQDILQTVCFTHGGAVGSSTGLSDGTETSATYRRRYTSLKNYAINDLQLVFANWKTGFNDNGEQDNPDTFTLKVVIEYPANTFYTVTFGGGSVVTQTMQSGAMVITDPLPIQIPANTAFYVRCYVTCSAGAKWPTYWGALTGFGDTYLTGVDRLTTASPTTTAGYIYEPLMILGKVKAHLPNVAIIGDSRAFGLNDGNGTIGEVGWIQRGITNTYGSAKFCKSSETLNAFINSINSKSRRRMWMMRLAPFTHVVMTYPINDLTGGRTDTQIMTDYATALAFFADLGLQTILTTPTPHTTSAGSQWINKADQTATGGTSTYLVSVINSLKAVPTNALACFDANGYLCDATDQRIWLTDGVTNKKYTSDGLHENTLGSTTLRDAFQTWYPNYIL